jgi:hypothetical protein
MGGQRGEGVLTKTKHSLHKKPQKLIHKSKNLLLKGSQGGAPAHFNLHLINIQ